MSQGWITTWNTRRTQGGLRDDDLPYVSALRAAQVPESMRAGTDACIGVPRRWGRRIRKSRRWE